MSRSLALALSGDLLSVQGNGQGMGNGQGVSMAKQTPARPGRTEPRRVQFATDKRRVEITGGKYRGDLGYVWFKEGKPERKVDKHGRQHLDRLFVSVSVSKSVLTRIQVLTKLHGYLLVTFDSGFTRVVQDRFVRVLADVEILYIEADEDMPDRPPRLEDVPVGPVNIPTPAKPRVRKLGDPPRLEDLE